MYTDDTPLRHSKNEERYLNPASTPYVFPFREREIHIQDKVSENTRINQRLDTSDTPRERCFEVTEQGQ